MSVAPTRALAAASDPESVKHLEASKAASDPAEVASRDLGPVGIAATNGVLEFRNLIAQPKLR
jgi:phage/plasmid-associated DNA primase